MKLKLLNLQLYNLDFNNKLKLIINKRINNYSHAKINEKLINSLNQNILYNFSKSSSPYYKNYFIPNKYNIILSNVNLKNNIYKYSFINNSARIGIIKFTIKFITSIFNSISCIIARPQFINKHNNLIIRIFFYKNNIYKEPLFNNANSNYIYNIILNNSYSKFNTINTNFDSNNLMKNIWIKWLKDYLNLNLNNLNFTNSNNKILTSNIINNYIKTNKIIENKLLLNKTSLNNNYSKLMKSQSIKKINKFKNQNILRNNKLLLRIANVNSLNYLNKKRINNLKQSFNRLLKLKLIKKYNNLNEKSTELTGKENLLHLVPKIFINKIFGGVTDSKNYIENKNEYLFISNYLLNHDLMNKKALSINKIYSKEIDLMSKFLKNKLILNLKLANKIFFNLNSLKYQFSEKNNQSLNFILNSLINQLNINFTNKNNLTNFKLFILNKQISLIKNLTINLLNKKSLIKPDIFNIYNNKLLFNIKILKLIINKFNHNDKIYLNYNKKIILNNKIKESYLAYKFYDNRIKNNENILKNNIIKFKWLGTLLSKIFKKNVNIELIRIFNVGLEPTILSKIVSKNSMTSKSSIIFKKLLKKIIINKNIKLKDNRQSFILEKDKKIYDKIFKLGYKNINNEVETILPYKSNNSNISNIINQKIKLLNSNKYGLKQEQIIDFIKDKTILNTNPITLAKITGMSLKIAGRLSRERIKPKKTINNISVGSIRREQGNMINLYKFLNKNKRGAYTISIKLASARTYSTNCRTIIINKNSFNSNEVKN